VDDLRPDRPPAIIVRFELEASPKVYFDCADISQEQRLCLWLDGRDAIRELIVGAYRLSLDEAA
jgi:hypothetical protein